MLRLPRLFILSLFIGAGFAAPIAPALGQATIRADDTAVTTYADLADLAIPARIVARADVTKVAALEPAQATNVRPGHALVYVEARTTGLLVGPDTGESLRFLADVALDAKGKVPKLRKLPVLLLATPVEGRPGELRLVAPDAMLTWTPETEQRLRGVLTELNAADAPPAITGLREVLHVPGNLAGEGETQLFFSTEGGKPVSLSVVRRPGEPTRWGVSFSEIVDQAARPPEKDTLAWYRLACALPATLPEDANISGTAEDQRIATEDYAQVLADLGPCTRHRPAAH